MSRSTPTAQWTAPALVSRLARAGWGPTLDGRAGQGMRSTLHAIVARADHQSGRCTVTAAQIADAVGLSERWVRRCLERLELLGLITWARGGVLDGRPTPGIIRLIKRNLAALIRSTEASRWLDERRADRARATAERIRELRTVTLPTRKRVKPLVNPCGTEIKPSPYGNTPPAPQAAMDGPAPVERTALTAESRALIARARAIAHNARTTHAA